MFRTDNLINGQWVRADSGHSLTVVNPADGQTLAQVPAIGAAETERAIHAAQAAGPAWRAQTGHARAHLLRRWHALILTHAESLAQLITREGGKPLAEARGEVNYGASFVEWFAEEAKRIDGDIPGSPQPGKRLLVLREPVGVVAAITPWNFPLAMITRKVAPALAAGCTVVVKPAEQTPLTALALADLAVQAGIPAGVLNVITGEASVIGAVLTHDMRVRKLSFTGSTDVGRLLMAQSAPSLKSLSLELGGNAPFIVFEDADLDAALEGAMLAKFRNAGQTCVCANRILVQRGLYARFVEALTERVQALQVGPGLQAGVNIGPLIDQAALERVEARVADAQRHGARLMCGGQRLPLGALFYAPTVLADVTADMRIAREEIFGPVAPVLPFDTETDAIALANATEHGLAAYLYTRDLARSWRVSEALKVGMVGLNTGLISNEVAPFGGVNQSGYGREGSRYGIEAYQTLKYVCVEVGGPQV